MNQTLTPERLAGFFDHTLLKPYATKKDFENFCNNCKQYRFAMLPLTLLPFNSVSNI